LRRVLHKLSVSSPWTPSSSEGFAPRTAALRFSQPGAGFARLPPCWGWDGRERSGGNYPDTGGQLTKLFMLRTPQSAVWAAAFVELGLIDAAAKCRHGQVGVTGNLCDSLPTSRTMRTASDCCSAPAFRRFLFDMRESSSLGTDQVSTLSGEGRSSVEAEPLCGARPRGRVGSRSQAEVGGTGLSPDRAAYWLSLLTATGSPSPKRPRGSSAPLSWRPHSNGRSETL